MILFTYFGYMFKPLCADPLSIFVLEEPHLAPILINMEFPIIMLLPNRAALDDQAK